MYGFIPWVTDWVISLCVVGHSMWTGHENTIMDMLTNMLKPI